MIQMKNPKPWLTAALLMLLLVWMLLIIKKHNEQRELQEKIDNHSEITDTIYK